MADEFIPAYQPELIRLAQKDAEHQNYITHEIIKILEPWIKQNILSRYLDNIKTISSLVYYLATVKVNSLGEEYVNVIRFNQQDFDQDFVPLTNQRKSIFILLKIIPFLIRMVSGYREILETIIKAVDEAHFAYFLIHGGYFELSKRIARIQNVFTRIPPTHGIEYNRLGRVYLVMLILQFLKYLYGIIKQVTNSQRKQIVKQNLDLKAKSSTQKRTQCLLCFDDATNISCTPCGHLFCWECILKTSELNPVCPLCRTECHPNRIVQLINYT